MFVFLMVCALIAVFVFFGLSVYRFWPYTLDDAFISYTYARNFSEGKGLVFNSGEQVEGFSNPLWVLLLGTMGWLGLPLLITAKWIGAIATFASLMLAGMSAYLIVSHSQNPDLSQSSRNKKTVRYRDAQGTLDPRLRTWRVPHRRPERTAMAAAVMCTGLMAVQPGYSYYGVAGLETQLFGTLIILGVFLHLKDSLLLSALGSRWCYLPLGAAAITRPEGMLFLLIVTIHRMCILMRSDGHVPGLRSKLTVRAETPPLIVSWLMPVGYIGWRLSYYGSLFPNTFYAKPGTLFENPAMGLGYLWDFILSYGWAIASFAILGVLWAVYLSPHKHTIRFLILLIMAYTGFVVTSGGDWMAHSRFFQHILPLICLVIAVSIATCPIVLRRAACVIVICLCAWRVQYVAAFWYDLKENSAYDHAHSSQYNIEMAQWMAEHLPAGASIVTDEIGAIGFYSGLYVIDQWGLIDKPIARILSENQFNPYSSAIDSQDRPRVQSMIARELLARLPDYVLIDYIAPWSSERGYVSEWVNPITMRELYDELNGQYTYIRGFPIMSSPPKTLLLFSKTDSDAVHRRTNRNDKRENCTTGIYRAEISAVNTEGGERRIARHSDDWAKCGNVGRRWRRSALEMGIDHFEERTHVSEIFTESASNKLVCHSFHPIRRSKPLAIWTCNLAKSLWQYSRHYRDGGLQNNIYRV